MSIIFSDDFNADATGWSLASTVERRSGDSTVTGNGSSGTDGFRDTDGFALVLRGHDAAAGYERHATTPTISTITAGGTISFDLIQGDDDNGGEDPDFNEGLYLEYSIDEGTSWTTYVHYLTDRDFTASISPDVPYPSGATPSAPFWGFYDGASNSYSDTIGWKTFTVPIPDAVVGQSNVQFRWVQKRFSTSQQHYDIWGLDNVSITLASPNLTSSTYDASSGTLVVAGANLETNSGALNDIDISQITLTGEGSNTYTLTSSDVEIDSSTQFTITLNAADQLQLAGLLNKNGTSSGGSATYNIAAASGWNPGASSSPADNTGNAIIVSNVTAPTLTSATYNASTGALTITGSNLPAYPGATNDLDVSALTITGGSGSTYTLTSTDIELTSATTATVTLNSTDQTNLVSLLNKNGTSSTQGTTYNIAAADDWAPGADSSTDIADLNGNAITVSAVNNAPVLTAPTAGSITETAGSSDTTTSGLTGTLSASDADGDTLTYGITGGTVASGTSTLAGTYGSLVVNTTTGAYTYTATSAAVEALCAGAVTDPFTVSVSDGTATTTSTYTVNITGADDPAVISGDITGTGTEDTSAITGTLSATDIEGLADNTYFTVSTTPSQGTASIDAASGAWSYTPNAHANGTDSFTVTITDDCGGSTTQAIGLTIAAAKDTWSFSNDYLEEQTGADLDGSGVIGDGTPGNATAPANLSSATYAAGDDYLVQGTLASTAALDAVKSFFSTFNTAQSITFDASSYFKFTNLSDTASNLDALSSTDIGNVTGTLTVSDSNTTAPTLTLLQSIKSKFSGTTFAYYNIRGTNKELADSRNDSGFDWISNITPTNHVRNATLTDLGTNPTTTQTLASGLSPFDYQFEITGLTADSESFVAVPSGDSFNYRSDASTDSTTSYTEGAEPYVSGNYTITAIGFTNTASPTEGAINDFNVSNDDVSNIVELTIHFYEGEQLSHVNISGADLSTSTGYSYTQTAGSSTTSVSDDIWTLSLKVDAGQPAKTSSVSDNTGVEVLGVMVNSVSAANVGGINDYGGAVFRTNAWWNDISLLSEGYKFSDLCPGFGISGTNTEEVDFDFYFTKSYLERAFSVNFDNIIGGFAGSGLSSVSSDNESTGTYIDVSKPGAISTLKRPVTITDVSATTAGGATDFYQVAFTNDSWSSANLALVYGPSVASTINGDTSGSGAEDTTINGDLDATDPQGLTDSTYFIVSTNPSNGSASIDPESGAWSYTPTANFNGNDSFTVTITDDLGGTTTQAIALTITAVDDPASITGELIGEGAEDTTITGTLTATDAEGLTDGTVFSIASGNTPTNGSASIDPESGAWSYTPTANFNGNDAFTVTITDDAGGTTTQAIELTITAVDDPASITGELIGEGAEDTTITGTLTATDAEGLTDGTVFSIASGNSPTNGSASIDAETGAWSYTPTANFNGTDAFTVTITDDAGGTTTQAIELTITAVDDSAVITGDTSGSGGEDSAIGEAFSVCGGEGACDGGVFCAVADELAGDGGWIINGGDGQFNGLGCGAAKVIGDGDGEGIVAVEVGGWCVGPGAGFGIDGSGAVAGVG